MSFYYDKLWNLINEKGMQKEDLRKATGMSSATLAKLSKNQNISMKSLDKICKALDCDVGDIIHCEHDKEE